MANAALALGTVAGYEKTGGYGSEAGQQPLRDLIVKRFYSEKTKINASEIFVSDGSKCDISRMQQMFGPGRKVAVQDPAYPAYVDSSVINGHCTGYDEKTKRYENIVYMECVPGNDFFPNLEAAKDADIIFFCSPNNPTGAAATRAQCKELVDFANKNGKIVIFDAAYAFYIENPDCPKTIFEIEGA
jgi:LL-diaminopimelate aminotransferase